MSQQALFADTIIAMKKAMKRRAYESDDSEDDIDYRGNRGQKLKKRARFAREGQLAPPSGPEVYKEYVNHAGYTRAIISRNAPLVDDEGYEPESDDEDYEQRMQDIAENAAEFNPYASVRLENILAPLAAVTDLPAHPTLSRPYTTKTLTDLARQSRDITQKENAALWKVKHLHTKLVGDHVWVPCAMMETANDLLLYQEPQLSNVLGQRSVNSVTSMLRLEGAPSIARRNGHLPVNGEAPTATGEESAPNKDNAEDADTSMVDADVTIDEGMENAGSRPETERDKDDHTSLDNAAATSSRAAATSGGTNGADGDGRRLDRQPHISGHGSLTNGAPKAVGQNGDSHNAVNGGHALNLPGSGPMSSASWNAFDEMFIHPIFLAPRTAQPNRDLGIPEGEAEDLRRLLQLYVQKQEEVCRGAKRLSEGLQRADRLRKTVLQWSKYEAHVGPNRDMSDGEDWYDKEEWGFEEDLKKGQDEEEEDTTQPTKKSTRNRR